MSEIAAIYGNSTLIASASRQDSPTSSDFAQFLPASADISSGPRPDGLPFERAPRADGLPYEGAPSVAGLPYERAPYADGLPYEQVPRADGLPYDRAPGADGVPYERAPRADGVPYERGPTAEGLPYEPAASNADKGQRFVGSVGESPAMEAVGMPAADAELSQSHVLLANRLWADRVALFDKAAAQDAMLQKALQDQLI